MTLSSQGAYVRLLCLQWENDGLPVDLGELALLVGRTKADFLAGIWQDLESKFPHDGKKRRNARLELERDRKRRKSEQAARAGTESGKSRRKRARASNLEQTLNHPDADAETDEERR